jgi:hypothetical protein
VRVDDVGKKKSFPPSEKEEMRLGLHPSQSNSPLRVSPAHILTSYKSPAENGSALEGAGVRGGRHIKEEEWLQ